MLTRPQVTRLDIEERPGKPFALLGEGPRRRRQALALGERPLERREPLLQETDALGQRLPLGAHALVEDAARSLEVGAESP